MNTDKQRAQMRERVIERMTYYATRLAAYEDIGLEPEEIKLLLDGLDEYRKVEAEGRLIVRPGTVYETDGVNIYESTVRKVIYDAGHIAFDDDAIGRSVFLTREDAEAKLASMSKEG